MLRSRALIILSATLLTAGCSRVSVVPGTQRDGGDEEIAWSYDGPSGPSAWADDYPACAGIGQSPIDIRPTAIADLPALEFLYVTVGGSIVDTGRALQVNTEGGALTVNDSTYTLRSISFHVPSMHTIEGRRFDAAMHLVHEGDAGRTVVVEVPFVVGEESGFIGDVLAAAARAGNDAPAEEIDVEDAAPENSSAYYTYRGSLPAPPCTEGVRWFVMRQPLTLSAAQLEELAGHYRNNVRPLQPSSERSILHRPG